MSKEVLIPFAISKKTRKLVSVDDVDSGLACDCECMSCGVSMVARKGGEKTHHFAHRSTEVDPQHVCNFSIQRAIFWMIREVSKELTSIALPEFIFSHHDMRRNLSFSEKVCDSSVYEISSVKIPNEHYSDSHDVLHFTSESSELDLVIITTFNPRTINLKELLSYQVDPVYIVTLNLNHIKQRLNHIQKGFKDEIKSYLHDDHIDKQWEYHPALGDAVDTVKLQINTYFKNLKNRSNNYINPYQRLLSKRNEVVVSKEDLKNHLSVRLNELVQAALDVKDLGYDQGFLCKACKFISPPDSLSCGYCGEKDFEIFDLGEHLIGTLKPKFDCWLYPQQSLKLVPPNPK